jgi:tyrosinase
LPKTPKEGKGEQQVVVSQENEQVSHDEYVMNVIYKKFALGGSPFTIHIYIGSGHHTKVGTVYNFSTPAHATGGPDGCKNCRNQEDAAVLATSQVPITNALLRMRRRRWGG